MSLSLPQTSQWRLKLPAPPLLARQIVKNNNKKNIKAARQYWAFVRDYPDGRWSPSHGNDSNAESISTSWNHHDNCAIHVMPYDADILHDNICWLHCMGEWIGKVYDQNPLKQIQDLIENWLTLKTCLKLWSWLMSFQKYVETLNAFINEVCVV